MNASFLEHFTSNLSWCLIILVEVYVTPCVGIQNLVFDAI